MDLFTDKLSGKRFCMKMDNECAKYILANGIFEYPLITWCQQFVKKDSIFLDIGAHMGTYSVILSDHCKEVHAFEPQTDTYTCLNCSVSANGCKNITTHNVALGEKEGQLSLNVVSPDGGGSTLRPDIPGKMSMKVLGTETVEVKTLDSFGFTNVGFIKMDVEGSELSVLKGAKETIKNNRFPPFIFEVWPNNWYANDKKELMDYITRLGYKIVEIGGVNNMYLACDHSLR